MSNYTKYQRTTKSPEAPEQFIGVKKGCLDAENLKLFQAGENFQYKGGSQDFVILPKGTK